MNISIRYTKIKEPAKKAYIRTVRNDCGEIVSSSLYLWLLDDEKKAIFDSPQRNCNPIQRLVSILRQRDIGE